MKVAIIHPWFFDSDGANKVVDALAEMYPNAELFNFFADRDCVPPHVELRRTHSSVLQSLLGNSFREKRTYFMRLFPWLVKNMDLKEYDLVFSSCGIAVMGARVRPDAVHVTYVHTPQRDCWDLYARRQANRSWVKRTVHAASATYVKTWELSAIQRVDHVVSNSRYIQHRVMKYFRRSSTVIYPPVNTTMGYLAKEPEDYYLSLSRLDREKKIDVLIAACNEMKRLLLIGGSGPEEARLKAIAGPTVRFLGRVTEDALPHLYAHCRAFLFAADEDFGIAPVEAQAFGRPVVAYGHGGCLETVRVDDANGQSNSGVFFSEQTPAAVMDAIQRFEAIEHTFLPVEIQQHARQFDKSVFMKNMFAFVDSALKQKSARSAGQKAIE